MAPLGYVEVLDGRGRIKERFPVYSWPLTVGRAYSNAIILDDPFVSPEHLSVERDETGRIFAQDLNSLNGLLDGPSGKRVTGLTLFSGKPFQIGHTMLRYCDIGEPVVAAVLDRGPRRERVPSWLIGTLSALIALLTLVLQSYFESYERLNIARSLNESLTILSILVTWSGLWSLVSRIVTGRFFYAQHFALACGAMLLSLALSTFSEWFEFMFPSVPVLWVMSLVGSGVILAILVFGHLGWASSMLRRPRLWAGLGVSCAVIGAGVVTDFAARDAFTTSMEYSGALKPLDSRWLPAVSVDHFIAESERVKTELKELVEKARPAPP